MGNFHSQQLQITEKSNPNSSITRQYQYIFNISSHQRSTLLMVTINSKLYNQFDSQTYSQILSNQYSPVRCFRVAMDHAGLKLQREIWTTTSFHNVS